MFKTALKRGLILGVIIVLIACVGMGVIDFTVFAIIAVLVMILAGVMTIVHNQRGDRHDLCEMPEIFPG